MTPRRRSAAAAAFAAAVPLVYVVTAGTDIGRRLDAAPIEDRRTDAVYEVGRVVARTNERWVFALAGVAIVAAAVLRRRLDLAAAATVVLAGAVATTDASKPLLARLGETFDDAPARAASYPSGHATVAAALGFALVLVAPLRLRVASAAVAATYAAGVGASAVAIASHFPSDVVGGYLVAAAWAAAALAVLRPERGAPAASRLVALASAAALVVPALVAASALVPAVDAEVALALAVVTAAAVATFAAVAALALARR